MSDKKPEDSEPIQPVKKNSKKPNANYKICNKIGSGSWGQVYLGTSSKTGKEVAIKFEASDSCSLIRQEALFYKLLKQIKGIPQVKWAGSANGWDYLVLELLGKPLNDLFVSCKCKFSLKTTLMLADQFIDRIESIHNASIIHRDLKPANLIMGLGTKADIVHVIDFGLAKRYCSETREHIPEKDGKQFMGTAKYSSKNTHLGKETSRRDDLEALGYILVYFCKGRLPWQDCTAKESQGRREELKKMKLSTSNKELCEGLPPEFEAYLNYCVSLEFNEEPNYAYLKNLFKAAYKAAKYPNDNVFDWS